jgi:FO synthase
VTLLEPAPSAAAETAAALERAQSGERVGVGDAAALLRARGDDLGRLFALAGAVRDAGGEASGRAAVITYSRKVFIPLTTLCRDRCHYCVFVDTPSQLRTQHKPVFMSAEQVLAVARQGAALGCKEALLTLGDRPEDRWTEARRWLDEAGYASTLDYVGAMARLITDETGLLAHLNPGVMSFDELVALRPAAPSMGMMLETTSRRLFDEPGQVHHGSPDKDPAVRLRVLEDAGRARIPFTTGVLIGIGETLRDRAESLIALRDSHERHGHVQEVIVQNFRAKPRTAMRDAPDAELLEYVAAVAVARIVLGPLMRIQVPPNLSDPTEFEMLVQAGADDWGGVSPLTADHVNPERPWPHLDDLRDRTAELGFELRERLTAHPEYILAADEWLDPAMRAPVYRLADPVTGLAAVAGVPKAGSNDSEPLTAAPDRPIRMLPARRRPMTGVPHLAEAAASDPAALDDREWVALLEASGDDLDALAAIADSVRRYTVGEAVSLVVNRNLTSTGFRREGAHASDEFDLDDVAAIAVDAQQLGATELCVQGLLQPTQDPESYLDIARAVKAAAPRLHLHAYRPQDVRDLADRGGRGLGGALEALRAAGVDTVPGTGVKVLSERVRRLVAPGDLAVEAWVEAIVAAHRAGLRSTSVLFYGHVETGAERIEHLRRLRAIQDQTRGFTEFVPIPLPGPSGGVPLVDERGPLDEHRAMVAVSRLLLSGSIPHIQIPWTRVGRSAAAELLRAGGDDLGGTLLDGRVKPEAGVEHGQELPAADAAAIAARMFRAFRLRTTDYSTPVPGASS